MDTTERQTSTRRWTYSSTRTGLLERAAEAYYLIASAGNQDATARTTIDTVTRMRNCVRETYGVELHKKRMLDIGPGQQLRHMRCFSTDNDVVGIDMDVILQHLNVADCIEMVRRNSLTRVAKTMVRKAIGVDREFAAALAKQVGTDHFDKMEVRRMDAAAMAFDDGTFDFVYSHSVFEHIDRPFEALSEVARVLAPGGVAYISIHLYTSHSGQHDPKMLVQTTPQPPFWPHLRPEHEKTVSPSAYLNKVRFGEWERMFARTMPGAVYAHDRHDRELAAPLAKLRADGELAEFEDDELLTVNFVALWQKPKISAYS